MARLNRGKQETTVREGSPFDHHSGHPPHVESCLAYHVPRIRAGIEGRGERWPSEIPPDPLGAARWWIGRQEPIKASERPRLVACHHVGGGQRWELPYLARLLASLQVYVALEDKAREVILAALFDQVYWRGEPVLTETGGPGQFLSVYDETMRRRGCASVQEYLELAKTRQLASLALKRMPK